MRIKIIDMKLLIHQSMPGLCLVMSKWVMDDYVPTKWRTTEQWATRWGWLAPTGHTFPQINVYNIHGHEIHWMSIFLNFLLGVKSCLFWWMWWAKVLQRKVSQWSNPKQKNDVAQHAHNTVDEEIWLTTWDVKNLVNNGINYQPQLGSRISSINSMDE